MSIITGQSGSMGEPGSGAQASSGVPALRGFFTPSKPRSAGRGAVEDTPATGRRDLGPGPLHLWNIQNTPATPGQDATDSEMAGEDQATKVWGTDINVSDVRKNFAQFIKGFREQEGQDEAGFPKFKEEVKYLKYLNNLYHNLAEYPREVIPILDDVINMMAQEIRQEQRAGLAAEAGGDGSQVNGSAATHHIGDGPTIILRPYNLKQPRAIRDLDPNDIEALVQVDGLVTRVSNVMPDMRVAKFVCERCQHSMWVPNEGGRVSHPTICANQACMAKHTMLLAHAQSLFSDKQLIKIQESPNMIPEGETPHAVTAFVYDALVDHVRPGDRVTVVGMYKAMTVRSNPRLRTVSSVLRTYITVLHVKQEQKEVLFAAGGKAGGARATSEIPATPGTAGVPATPGTPGSMVGSEVGSQGDVMIDSQDPFNLNNLVRMNLQSREDELMKLGRSADIYERLTASLAPSIWQMEDVKKGILCQLFGAATKKSSKARSMINILLVGDPGVSKSQLLTYVHKVAPRGLYTSGRGSSAVGLTAYVTKDPESKEHVLESGALVLSDEGICCIDEFDKMSESARAMLHEVMEQQTVSVAKAGIIATLNARTSVLAAANPRTSRYDPRSSIVENINLPPSLLSRFDLVYLLLDRADANHDQRLARHLASLYWEKQPESTRADISVETLKEYIAFARHQIPCPKITEDAKALLAQSYLEMRTAGQDPTGALNKNVISATPRQLESLVRLSEALARMEMQKEVLERHVQEALRLMKVSMQQSAMDHRTGMIDMDKLYSGVGAFDREMRRHLSEVIGELLQGAGREMSVLEITNAVNEAAGPGGVRATHALVQKVLSSMESITYDSTRGRARANN